MPQHLRWLVRYPLGTTDALRSMGTVAAPLLAGFALATLAVLLTGAAQVRFAGPATFALAVASSMFVLCVQFTFTGLLYSATPAERTDWLHPEPDDPSVAQRLQRVQRKDHQLQGRYLTRARITYDIGIISLLAALLALVAPQHWPSWRAAAFLVVTISLLLELIWVVGGRLRHPPGWLLPSYRDVQPQEQDRPEDPRPSDRQDLPTDSPQRYIHDEPSVLAREPDSPAACGPTDTAVGDLNGDDPAAPRFIRTVPGVGYRMRGGPVTRLRRPGLASRRRGGRRRPSREGA
jgi:hypothetical protein